MVVEDASIEPPVSPTTMGDLSFITDDIIVQCVLFPGRKYAKGRPTWYSLYDNDTESYSKLIDPTWKVGIGWTVGKGEVMSTDTQPKLKKAISKFLGPIWAMESSKPSEENFSKKNMTVEERNTWQIVAKQIKYIVGFQNPAAALKSNEIGNYIAHFEAVDPGSEFWKSWFFIIFAKQSEFTPNKKTWLPSGDDLSYAFYIPASGFILKLLSIDYLRDISSGTKADKQQKLSESFFE